MIRLVDIIKNNEYNLYRNLRYGISEQATAVASDEIFPQKDKYYDTDSNISTTFPSVEVYGQRTFKDKDTESAYWEYRKALMELNDMAYSYGMPGDKIIKFPEPHVKILGRDVVANDWKQLTKDINKTRKQDESLYKEAQRHIDTLKKYTPNVITAYELMNDGLQFYALYFDLYKQKKINWSTWKDYYYRADGKQWDVQARKLTQQELEDIRSMQLHLMEQGRYWFDKIFGPFERFWKPVFDWIYENRHTILMVAEVAALLLPGGVFIAAGIGMANAALYAAEGDYEEAGIAAIFALAPGVPKIPGVKQLIRTLHAPFKTGAKVIQRKLAQWEKEALEKVSEYISKTTAETVEQTMKAEVRHMTTQQIKSYVAKLALQNTGKVAMKVIGQKFDQMVVKILDKAVNVIITKGTKVLLDVLVFEIFYTNCSAYWRYYYEVYIRMSKTNNDYMESIGFDAVDNYMESVEKETKSFQDTGDPKTSRLSAKEVDTKTIQEILLEDPKMQEALQGFDPEMQQELLQGAAEAMQY